MPPISRAMAEIGLLAEALGVERINEMDGCWEYQVDSHWSISVNGHPEPTKNSRNADVPPFSVYIEFNGWPAGIIDPFGGVIAAGAVANEAAFIDALRNARIKSGFRKAHNRAVTEMESARDGSGSV